MFSVYVADSFTFSVDIVDSFTLSAVSGTVLFVTVCGMVSFGPVTASYGPETMSIVLISLLVTRVF